MRNNELATVAQLTEFDEVIDVRSEAEFAEDHIPGAINCPALNNEERAHVGALYTRVSHFDAKKVGAAGLMVIPRLMSRGTSTAAQRAHFAGVLKAGGDLPANPAARLQDGALEGSNVSPVATMVAMIAAARQFEQQMKLMQIAQTQGQQSAKLLGTT